MPNQYTGKTRPVITPIGPSISYVPLTKGRFALISSEDAARVGRYCWHATWRPTCQDWAARRNALQCNGAYKTEFLHIFLLGKKEGFTVDHKVPGTGLNCLPHNLRHATRYEQSCNQAVRKDSSSGAKGISYSARYDMWIGRIRKNGKSVFFGHFRTLESAKAAYAKASLALHGEFART